MYEILFRAKSDEYQNRGEWIYGFYREYRFSEEKKNCFMDQKGKNESFYIDPETVGQYTGKMINSWDTLKEEMLFGGDIIQWSEDYDDKFGYPATYYGKGVIVWNEANCCFGVKTSETNIQDFNDFDFDESCWIVGNIYDNPELLQEV